MQVAKATHSNTNGSMVLYTGSQTIMVMNWDEDIDLLAGRKLAPKQGRRSNSNTPEDNPGTSNFFGDTNPFDTNPQDDKPLIKPRKTSVWGDDGSKSAKTSRSNTTNIIEMERFQDKLKNDEDDIPVIPDIDELQENPLNLPDIKPTVTIDKSTYQELNNQIGAGQLDKINFGNLGNIDLSFLTNKLYQKKDVEVKQEVWTMESLFNDLARSISDK